MDLNLNDDSISVFQALSSKTRVDILHSLTLKDKNITELASELHLSTAIVTRHIHQLEESGLIKCAFAPGKAGRQKVCSLSIEMITIHFPKTIYPDYKVYETSIPIGHFTNYYVEPTCGMATTTEYIGLLDDPKYFMDSKRMEAELLWFGKGFIEYKIPNYIHAGDSVKMIEISMEIASEFPVSNNNWPSDISFYLNDNFLGTWTCPGNFSDIRGKLTPEWWPERNSQYGLLKHIRITEDETQIDGEKISDTSLKDLDLNHPLMNLRIAVEDDSKNVGGITIFGKKFGNHNQDIKIKVFYT